MRAPVNAAVINGKVSTAGAVTSPLLRRPSPPLPFSSAGCRGYLREQRPGLASSLETCRLKIPPGISNKFFSPPAPALLANSSEEQPRRADIQMPVLGASAVIPSVRSFARGYRLALRFLDSSCSSCCAGCIGNSSSGCAPRKFRKMHNLRRDRRRRA